MNQSVTWGSKGASFGILLALSLSHFFNDMLQSVITAVYPLLKEDLVLSFAQIGIITLIYQTSASVFQPVVGLYLDKRPNPWFLPIGMSFTLLGMFNLAYATTVSWVMISVSLIGFGSSILHPEASRITFLASGGKRGLAQSLFQVGGNLGGSLGPLLVALLIAPYGRQNVAFMCIIAFIAILVMIPVCRWYKRVLQLMKQEKVETKSLRQAPLSGKRTTFALIILLVLIFSKYVYMASLSSYYTFYLMEKFNVSIQQSQVYLFIFLFATAAGTLMGGPIGDKIGRKYVIWISILGTAPFSLMMPHANLLWTCILSFLIGFILSSAFPAILLYAQELLPYRLGMISGLFFGFAFGIAGIASAVLGGVADQYGIETVYNICAFMPILGLVAWWLPDLNKNKKLSY